MTVFITGATAGFGAAIAKKFLDKGDKVIAVGRRAERLSNLKKQYGDSVFTLTLDVRNQDEVINGIKSLPKEFSQIDILINNAGLALGLEPAQKANLDDWNVMVDTNIKGVLNCTSALLPQMVARNSGLIINLGSVAGEFPYPGGNVYGATKAFVHQFSLNLRADLFGTKVRVTNIEPGLCGGTEFSEVRFKGEKKKADAMYVGIDYLKSEDIAETVLWVASRPSHVNINVISLMPVGQSFSAFAIHRKP